MLVKTLVLRSGDGGKVQIHGLSGCDFLHVSLDKDKDVIGLNKEEAFRLRNFLNKHLKTKSVVKNYVQE